MWAVTLELGNEATDREARGSCYTHCPKLSGHCLVPFGVTLPIQSPTIGTSGLFTPFLNNHLANKGADVHVWARACVDGVEMSAPRHIGLQAPRELARYDLKLATVQKGQGETKERGRLPQLGAWKV